MGDLGFSIKFWRMDFIHSEGEFKLKDSVTFVFQDRPPEEWARLGNLIEELIGDGSLGQSVADILTLKVQDKADDLGAEVKIEKKEVADQEDQPSPLHANINGSSKTDPDMLVNRVETNGELPDEEEEIMEDDRFIVDEEEEEEDADSLDDWSSDERRARKKRIASQRLEYCDNCEKCFKYRKNLLSHLEHCNPEQLELLLPRKGRKKKKKSLGRFVVKESCKKCMKAFKHRKNLVSHLEQCNPRQIPLLPKKKRKKLDDPNSCRYCHRQFIFRKSLQKHEELHRLDPESSSLRVDYQAKRNSAHKQDALPRGSMYQCDKCECDFKVYSALERHIQAHALAARTSPDPANIEEGRGFKMIDVRDGRTMRCMRCDLAFTTHGIYRLHMQKFHKKAFPCEECAKRFTLPNTLVKHRLNYHTNFPKSCEDCGLVLSTKHAFVKHVNTLHSTAFQESTVPCEICGKLVKNKYTLKQHVRLVHEKKKGEFACDQCGKVLKSKGSLDYHKRTHSGEYAYRCEECGRGHMRYDKMMECLAEHQGIHKYQCPHCDYKSNQLGYYKNHLTTHSDAKPFICPVCGHLSSTSANLNSHTSKVHKITLCQAEGMMKRNRHGRDMTDEELEQNRITLLRNSKQPGDEGGGGGGSGGRTTTPQQHRKRSSKAAAARAATAVAKSPPQPQTGHEASPQEQPQQIAGTNSGSWESGMARLEAGLRQQQDEMVLRQELANLAANSRHHNTTHHHHHHHHQPHHVSDSGNAMARGLGDHFHRMAAAEAAAAAAAAAAAGMVAATNGGIFPKQERHQTAAATNTAAVNFSDDALVMPRHMLFPVHKYFQDLFFC